MNNIFCQFLMIFFIVGNLFSQESMLKLSKLGDPKYFENYVKYIPDEILFESMDLELKGLEKVKRYVGEKNYQKAFEEWGLYFERREKLDVIEDLNNQYISKADFLERYNESYKKMILEDAEKVMKNEIMGWGTTVFKFNDIIDFNANYGDSGKYGFHYFWWSRPLYLARIITNDMKYTEKFDNIFSQWYDQRYRVSYVYSEWNNIYYELGIGNRNSIFISNYCFENKNRSWLFHEKMLKTMLGSGNWLYLMEKHQPYTYENRQLVAITMLGMIGIYFPEFKDSKKWIELAYEKTLEHLEKDFFEDGANIERSPNNYTILTYNSIRNFYYLLKLINYDEQKLFVLRDKLVKTINFWVMLLAPNGDIISTNDCHRSTLPYTFFIDAIKLYDQKDNMGVLHSIFGIKDYSSYPLPTFTSINLPISKFAIMRTDWSNDANYMAINYGGYSGGHSHPDILSFDIYGNNKSLAIESAIGWTYDDTLHTKWYKTSLSHNMIVVNDSNLNKKEAIAENTYWMTNKKYDYFTGEDNHGYSRFSVKYKRDFLFIKPDMWVIYDDINSEKNENQISTNIHIRGKIEFVNNYFTNTEDSGLVVIPANNYLYSINKGIAQIKFEKKDDDFEELSWIKYYKKGEGNINFCNLIYPFKNKSRKEIIFKEISLGRYKIIDNDYNWDIFFRRGIDKSNIKSDARCIIIKKGKEKIIDIQVIDGSFLTIEKKEYLKNNKKGDYEIHF